MNWIKLGLLAAGMTGALAALGSYARKKQEEQLDDYLMDDPEEVAVDAAESLPMDIELWKTMDEASLPVIVSFSTEDEQAARQLQALLAREGLSSSYDGETGIVDILYLQQEDADKALAEAGRLPGIVYQGFAVTE